MYIQYVGFKVDGTSRIYNYAVLDAKEKRAFTVKVGSEAFRPAGLSLQDGPSICFDRLKRELGAETGESRAGADLSIGERDIGEYLERQCPRKLLVKKAASGR